MPLCTNCGAMLTTPQKSWSMVGKPYNTEGERMELSIGIFTCPSCHSRSRMVTGKSKVKVIPVEKIAQMESELMELSEAKLSLEGRIKALENEKITLTEEVGTLREIADLETKAAHLENEVQELRQRKQELEGKRNQPTVERQTEEEPSSKDNDPVLFR